MFSTKEAATLARADVRNVDYWCKIGLVTSTVPATGTGSDRKFSVEDVILLAALADLAKNTNVQTRRLVVAALRATDLLRADRIEVQVSQLLKIVIFLERIRNHLSGRA